MFTFFFVSLLINLEYFKNNNKIYRPQTFKQYISVSITAFIHS